jgi:hypothetical protein
MLQRLRTITVCLTIAIGLPLSAAEPPNRGGDGRIHILDPRMLAELGYPEDATNIYATGEVVRYLQMIPGERAAANAAANVVDEAGDAGGGPGEARSAFGDTSGVSNVHSTDFEAQSLDSAGYPLFGVYLSCAIPDSGNANFRGVLRDIPHGASVRFRRIWYYDDDPNEDLTVWVERICLPFEASGDAEVTVLRMDTSSGTPGFGRFGPGTSIDEDADNLSCVYTFRARLSNDNFCNMTSNNSLRIYKASLSWRRQVSPAPAAAAFNDVPTSHPFFQFIEALAASGITAGCQASPPLYCPDAPLTRGQMAVFLAKALGLNWSEPFWVPGS